MKPRRRQKQSVEACDVLADAIREIAAQANNPDLFFKTAKDALREALLRAITASDGQINEDQRQLIDANLDTAINAVAAELCAST